MSGGSSLGGSCPFTVEKQVNLNRLEKNLAKNMIKVKNSEEENEEQHKKEHRGPKVN